MSNLSYLSVPYSYPDAETRNGRVAVASIVMADLIENGRLAVCPVIMMHAAAERIGNRVIRTSTNYWLDLEKRLASLSDELVVIMETGWRESRGVTRELALFEAAGKPVYFVASPDDAPRAQTLFDRSGGLADQREAT